jgi:hypothetical protein
VILGRFTTETHAMARSITADTPDRYLHHTRGRTQRLPSLPTELWSMRSTEQASPCGRRRADVLAYFDHHTSNGPTEGINGRLEALRGNALGIRNLTHTGSDPYCTAAASLS